MLSFSTLGAGIFWMPTASGVVHFPTASLFVYQRLSPLWIPIACALLLNSTILSMILLSRRDMIGFYGLALGISVLGGFWKWFIPAV